MLTVWWCQCRWHWSLKAEALAVACVTTDLSLADISMINTSLLLEGSSYAFLYVLAASMSFIDCNYYAGSRPSSSFACTAVLLYITDEGTAQLHVRPALSAISSYRQLAPHTEGTYSLTNSVYLLANSSSRSDAGMAKL